MYLLSIVLMITVLGCGSTAGKTLKMEDFTKAFSDAGINVDAEKTPIFLLIHAKDGVGFSMVENNKAKIVIYEYASKKDLDQAEKDFVTTMKDWPVNGLFVLESSDDKAAEIFKNVK